MSKEDEARNVVVELTGVEQKKDSVVFKVVLLEGKGIESFEASSLFIDIIMTGAGPGHKLSQNKTNNIPYRMVKRLHFPSSQLKPCLQIGGTVQTKQPSHSNDLLIKFNNFILASSESETNQLHPKQKSLGYIILKKV